VVDGGVEAEQRPFEAVLSARLAVTAARVAAELAQERHHRRLEVDRSPLATAPDDDLDAGPVTANADQDAGGAIADRCDVTVFVEARPEARRGRCQFTLHALPQPTTLHFFERSMRALLS
jgi:hypothetical protein